MEAHVSTGLAGCCEDHVDEAIIVLLAILEQLLHGIITSGKSCSQEGTEGKQER